MPSYHYAATIEGGRHTADGVITTSTYVTTQAKTIPVCPSNSACFSLNALIKFKTALFYHRSGHSKKMKAATKSNFFQEHQYLREIRDRYRFLMFSHFGEGV